MFFVWGQKQLGAQRSTTLNSSYQHIFDNFSYHKKLEIRLDRWSPELDEKRVIEWLPTIGNIYGAYFLNT